MALPCLHPRAALTWVGGQLQPWVLAKTLHLSLGCGNRPMAAVYCLVHPPGRGLWVFTRSIRYPPSGRGQLHQTPKGPCIDSLGLTRREFPGLGGEGDPWWGARGSLSAPRAHGACCGRGRLKGAMGTPTKQVGTSKVPALPCYRAQRGQS